MSVLYGVPDVWLVALPGLLRARFRLIHLHCSYHKCLTVLFQRVMRAVLRPLQPEGASYKHFKSWIDDYYANKSSYRFASVNNHAVDLDRLGSDARITRFVRDPRDLVVSGYFYHRRGAEQWCNIESPSDEDFRVVNGVVPSAVRQGESYAQCLQRLSVEEGLTAEIEFRARHFASMLDWTADSDQILTFRYEDIVGNEPATFRRLLSFHEFERPRIALGVAAAKVMTTSKARSRTTHVRDPQPGQWRRHFSAELGELFNSGHAEILDRYGYPHG